jgi:hypothetical protein
MVGCLVLEDKVVLLFLFGLHGGRHWLLVCIVKVVVFFLVFCLSLVTCSAFLEVDIVLILLTIELIFLVRSYHEVTSKSLSVLVGDHVAESSLVAIPNLGRDVAR